MQTRNKDFLLFDNWIASTTLLPNQFIT